tara:strand:+ start:3122 stop:4075 length:954 start_codon:yes stop_codon:yes gene_type:complete
MGSSAKRSQARIQEKMFAATEKQLREFNAEKVVQRKLLEKQKAVYREFDFVNPYADMKNQFAGMRNYFTGMENVFEEGVVDTQAAEFQMQQGAQQRANIMSALQGAAGGSGIASLAQTLANQGALQARQASVDIAQQARQNRVLRAQAEMQLQTQERTGMMRADMLQRQGAGQADMTERGGAAMVQSAEMQRQATLLGIEYGGMAGANAGVQAAYANQMAGFGHASQMASSRLQFAGQMIGAGASLLSDRRLKKNINKIGESPSGLNIYSFEYIDSKYGEGLFQGVISDEVPQGAVVNIDGYDRVNYNMLDVEFKQI